MARPMSAWERSYRKRTKPKKPGYGIKISKPTLPKYTGGFGTTPQAAARTPVAPAQAPASPATPGYNPQPLTFSPVYENTVGDSNRSYDQTVAANAYQRNRVKQTYGFDDPSDPFNRAAMLQKHYQQRTQGTTNSFAASGQLYSGATQRNLDQGRSDYDQSYAALRRSYDDELFGLDQADLAALNAKIKADNDAFAEWVANQPQPEDPGAPYAPPKPKKGGGSFSAKKPKPGPPVKGKDLKFALPKKKKKGK